MRLWQLELPLSGVFEHAAFGESIHAALTHESFSSGVLSEEEVEHDAHDRHKREHQKPGHGLGGLPVVHQHFRHHAEGSADIDDEKDGVEVVHV